MLAPRPTRAMVAGALLGCAVWAGVSAPAAADPCSLSHTSLPPTADTWIAVDAVSHATAQTLEVRTLYLTSWPARVALLQFDLTAIPAGATVQSATLSLTLVETDAEVPLTYHIGLHQIINVKPDLDTATGNTYADGQLWTGVTMAQGDIAPEASDLDVDKTLETKSWDATKIVRAWVAQPDTNYGFLLNADKSLTGTRWRNFASLEYPTATEHPVLDVTWCIEDDGGVPDDGGDDAGGDDAGGEDAGVPDDAGASDAVTDADAATPGDAPAVDAPANPRLRPIVGWSCAAAGATGAGAAGAALFLLGLVAVLARRGGRPGRAPTHGDGASGGHARRSRGGGDLLLLGLMLGLGALPAVAMAQREPARLPLLPAAQARLDSGVKLYGERRFDEAIREFSAGYDIDPRPDFLYALGQAHRARGDCERATEYFLAFLRTVPPPAQQEKARVQLARCERTRLLAAASAPSASRAAPPPDPVLPAAVPTPTVVTTPPAPRGGRFRLMLDVTGLGDVVGRTGAAEVGARVGLGAYFDVGAAALLGEHTGARVIVGLHPKRRRVLNPSVEARGVVHPVAGAVALGGGLWLGATCELGPGRLRAGVAAELFSAPAGYRSYAVLLGGGYQLDVVRR